MTRYVLPELPYDYAALEPHISGKIMELHHDKHHAAYVKGANAALEGLAKAREANDTTKVAQLTRDLGFNVAGHVNHSIFWQNLSPDGGGTPAGEMADALARDFGSFEGFKQQFGAVAASVQGSGWAVLAYEQLSDATVVFQMHDQQNGLPATTVPLLMLDMWEHAFYLDYQSDKASYIKAFWAVVNWDDVARRLVEAVAQAKPQQP